MYVTYLGLLEPIPKAQVLPYLLGLSSAVDLCLVSFEKKNLLRENPAQVTDLERQFQEKGIRWVRLSYHKYPRIVSSLWDIIIGSLVCASLVFRNKVNILHVRSNVPGAIGYLVKKITRVRLIYDRRGVMGDDHVEHSGWREGGFLHRLARGFEKRLYAKSDAVVILTEKAKEQIYAETAGKVLLKTIPCCVDLKLFDVPVPMRKKSAGFVFVYSGSLGSYNLLDEMLDFFSAANLVMPQARLLILTQNASFALGRLKGFAHKDKVDVSFIERQRLPQVLSSCDAGIIFRKISSSAPAASPTKFSEYLACGLAVVANAQIGDIETIISSRKLGSIIKNYSDGEYLRAARELEALILEGSSVRERCRKAAREIYALERGVTSYRQVYEALLKES